VWRAFGAGSGLAQVTFMSLSFIVCRAKLRLKMIKGSAWEFPDHENAETFVDRLVRNEVLNRDPLVLLISAPTRLRHIAHLLELESSDVSVPGRL
jgi:cobalamin biosynthesis protein CbiG